MKDDSLNSFYHVYGLKQCNPESETKQNDTKKMCSWSIETDEKTTIQKKKRQNIFFF